MSRNQAKRTFLLERLRLQAESVASRKDAGVTDEVPQEHRKIEDVIAPSDNLAKGVAEFKPVPRAKGVSGESRLLALLRYFAFALVIPAGLTLITHYGFTTAYTTGTFSEAGFRAQYEHDIYRYRVLGRELVLATYHTLVALDAPARTPLTLAALDDHADPRLYASLVLGNLVFTCVTCALVLAWLRRRPALDAERGTLLVALLIAIGQFVVVPYDALAYALLAAAALALDLAPSAGRSTLLVVLVALSTLTRETAVLTLALYVAHEERALRTQRRARFDLGVLVAAFVASYLALRVMYGFDRGFFSQIWLPYGMRTARGWIGVGLLLAITFALSVARAGRRERLVFLGASLPYLLAVLVVAEPWELRLWVPLWIGMMISGRVSARPQPRRLVRAPIPA